MGEGIPHDEQPMSAPPTPKTIGPYKIESLLEKGGMSLLYLGTHPDTKEPVTIKVLSPKYLSHPEMVHRFLKEAEIIAMTDHPNIVKLYGHGEWAGGLYIAMEFIQGVSLRQHLLQTPMSLKRALDITLDIAYALCHLHTHGVIHRDVKPENILVTETGVIKVIDFGIAQLLTETSPQDVYPKQRIIGTPIYMSPEQKENPEAVSYPSDIYSLGIISYELVLGKLSHGQIHISLMPKGLQKIISKALQYKPEDRYQDIVDFITDVTGYLHSSHLQKEKKVGDQLSELSENLKQAQSLLNPPEPTHWPHVELGLCNFKGINLGSIYYDFFEIPNGSYGIFIGECSAKGAEGIIYTAVFRGMVRSLSRLAAKPADLMTVLNDILIQDPMHQIFTVNYLVISPSSHEMHYISCGYSNLWVLPAGVTVPTKISTENCALGLNAQEEFIESVHPLREGETVILSSIPMHFAKEGEDTDFSDRMFRDIVIENALHPPKKMVENILRKIRISSPHQFQDRPLTFIALSLQ